VQTEGLSPTQKAGSVNYRRRQPDVFELMMLARTRVFVRCAPGEYVIVSALRQQICLLHFCYGQAEAGRIEYVELEEQQLLELFDGKAWDLPALVKWLKSLEE
jgi:hypothetical protein